MGMQFSLPADAPISVLLPAETDAAGRISRFARLTNAIKAYVIVGINQGNAAPVEISLLQAQDTSGTGSKPLAAAPIWLCDNTATGDVLAPQSSAAQFTTDASLQSKLVIFEILPEATLDISNGFTSIAVETSASNAANVTRADLLYLPQIKAPGSNSMSTFAV